MGNVVLGLMVVLVGCASPPAAQPPREVAPPPLVEWEGGLPPLDRVRGADFAPAFAWVMQRKREELERIASQRDPATFENTIVAFERAGLALADLRALFDLWGRAFRDEAYDAAEQALAPQLATFDAEVLQEPRLANRVEAVWRARGEANTEQRRLIELVYQRFAPARLSASARARVVAVQRQDTAHAPRFALQPWDLRYYEEQVRSSQYQLDEAEVASYLELARVRDAAFWVAGQLFDLEVTALPDSPVPSSDVTVWSVARAGKRIGVLVFDPHPRPGKDSGAWALALRDQQRLVPGRVPVVSVHYNLARDHLTWFEAVGVFHELGHALQALLSDVTYPSVAGLNIAGDTLEMASQWFERYVATPEVIARFTRHTATGAPMPVALVERIERARNFAEGIRTMAMLQTSVLDLDLHSRSGPFDLAGLERAAATAAHAPPEVSSVGGAVQAGFLFGGENYAAQFYSYLWSDALAAEVYEAFLAGQGPYDRAVAERLRANVLARGDSLAPADAYQRVVGKPVGVDALLRKRGLAGAR